MKQLASGRIFASHYQFCVLDCSAVPFENGVNWDNEKSKRGYFSTDCVLYIGTKAHLNDHWVNVFFSEQTPYWNNCQRAIALNMAVPSGRVGIISPIDSEPVIEFELKPGQYKVYVLASNIGVDQMSLGEEAELSDAQLEKRIDLGRYSLVFVPTENQTENQFEGVIKGSKYLD